MAQDQPVKALVIALTDHAAAAVYSINRLQPDSLCFVLPEGAKALVESEVQPNIEHLPRRWDWVILAETGEFVSCYQTLARTVPEMLRAWEVQPGELVVDVTGATSAMAGALTLVTMPMSSRIVSLVPAREGQEDDRVDIAGQPFIWTQGNPWDEAASISRSTEDCLPQRRNCSARLKQR
jgi:CRISPR-associated protein (Cas_Cas02710)